MNHMKKVSFPSDTHLIHQSLKYQGSKNHAWIFPLWFSWLIFTTHTCTYKINKMWILILYKCFYVNINAQTCKSETSTPKYRGRIYFYEWDHFRPVGWGKYLQNLKNIGTNKQKWNRDRLVSLNDENFHWCCTIIWDIPLGIILRKWNFSVAMGPIEI